MLCGYEDSGASDCADDWQLPEPAVERGVTAMATVDRDVRTDV